MASNTLEIRSLSPRDEPFNERLHACILEVSHHGWNSEDVIKFVVGDKTGLIRVTCANKRHSSKIIKDKCILLKNFTVTPIGLTIKERTVMMLSSKLDIPKSIKDKAQGFLNTPVNEIIKMEKLKTSPVKSTISVKGVVVSEEKVKTVQVKNQTTNVKEIKLEDETDTIRCTLWRSATEAEIKVGQTVVVMDSNVTYNNYHKSNVLNISDKQAIVLIDEDKTANVSIEIIGVDKFDDCLEISLYIATAAGEKTVTVNKGLFSSRFEFDEFSSLEDVLEALPLQCEVILSKGEITSFIK